MLFSETCAFWLRSIAQCCGVTDEKPRRNVEKSTVVLRDQPALIPPPSVDPAWHDESVPNRQWSGRSRRRPASRGSSSLRRRWFPSSRRPQISAPSNFRHLYSESFRYLGPQPPHRQRSPYRPLELSIYLPDNHLSSILPHFDEVEEMIAPPQPARTNSTWDGSSATLTHEGSYSTLSFRPPRRQLQEESSFSSSSASTPPRVPPRSRARPRAYTSPDTTAHHQRLIERIASAIIEKERLEAEIESVLDRQSVYINSRPSTAYGVQELEPMPSIPALPAAAPSFAERLSSEGRPHTAPSQPLPKTQDRASFAEALANFNPPPPVSYSRVLTDSPGRFQDEEFLERPLAPPLPLVLRPPLRKKKSFSRVSSWLFPGSDHHRTMSFDSVTNRPKPVTGREGFYQCVVPQDAPPRARTRTSMDSVSSLSTWESEEEGQTVPTVPTTNWSPASSPVAKSETPKGSPAQERRGTFGGGVINVHRPQSVGVAL